MEKALVEVFVPVMDRSFDMFIPIGVPMYRVLELIKKAVVDMSDREFTANENTTICDRENGAILNINLSVYELGIKNGSKLMLI